MQIQSSLLYCTAYTGSSKSPLTQCKAGKMLNTSLMPGSNSCCGFQRISHSPFFCGVVSKGLSSHRRAYDQGLLTSPPKISSGFLLPFKSSLTTLTVTALPDDSEKQKPGTLAVLKRVTDINDMSCLSAGLHFKDLTG